MENSLEEPLINASCCNDVIHETFATTAKKGLEDGIEALRASQQVLPWSKPFPVNLIDHSEGQLILSNVLSEAKATGWGNTYVDGKKLQWISARLRNGIPKNTVGSFPGKFAFLYFIFLSISTIHYYYYLFKHFKVM
jgi:hypothetical protein